MTKDEKEIIENLFTIIEDYKKNASKTRTLEQKLSEEVLYLKYEELKLKDRVSFLEEETNRRDEMNW